MTAAATRGVYESAKDRKHDLTKDSSEIEYNASLVSQAPGEPEPHASSMTYDT